MPSTVTTDLVSDPALASSTRASRAIPARQLLQLAATAARSKKAEDLVALDLSSLRGVADYFLICTGQSEPQVKAISEAVEDQLREAGAKVWHIEGREGRRWVLLDYVDVVVHVFHTQTREYYLLERLWGDAGSVDLGVD